jgi:hypothetical protein
MNRRAFLSTAILAHPGPLRRGVQYLWSQQAKSGGWHSQTYGLLRSGQSLTPLIVNALLDAGTPSSDPRLQRALAFLARQIGPEGAVGLTADDYPCYATALTLRAFVRTRRPGAEPLVAWLRTQQMSPENGWQPADIAFGAWGIGGAPRIAPNPGHIDISMTRHVLEALAEAGVPPSDPAMKSARTFIARCENPDGGFYFSTVETGANKAGEYLSYGTTTADGMLCQLATGMDHTRTLRWLQANDSPSLPQGFTGPRLRYAEGLRYYYADAATRAFRAAGTRRATPFKAPQQPNGSWRNAEPLVKEDDPLVATAFAISALALA